MKAIIFCDVCAGTEAAVYQEVEAPTLSELGPLIAATLTLFHATPPHCPHRICMSLEDNYPTQMPRSDNELIVRCLKCGVDQHTLAPIELVPAIVVVFHSSHEAHPLELSYAGRTIRAPGI